MNEAKSILALSCYLIQRGNYDKERQNETEVQPKFKESKIEETNKVKIRHRKRANFQRRNNDRGTERTDSDKGTEGTDSTESKE